MKAEMTNPEDDKVWFACATCKRPLILIKAAPKAVLLALAGQVGCDCGQVSSFGTGKPMLKNKGKR